MSLRLIKARNGKQYKNWYIFGSLDGQKIEKSTGTNDRQLAKEVLADFLETYRKAKKVKKFMSFGQAAERYLDYRKPSIEDTRRVNRLCALIGNKPIMDVVQDDVYRIAQIIYPNAKASTKNRYIITPASTILNYAVSNQWCQPIKLKRFKEAAPKPRFVSAETEQKLHNALRGQTQKRLLLLWLFRQGDRISDILRIKYEDCDLENMTIQRHISKSDTHTVLPLDEAIARYIKKTGLTTGFIFPWRTRFGVAKWLRGLGKTVGVDFTAHMARHTLGKRLSDAGTGLKPIMDILGQTDPRSSIRYQNTGIDELRRAKNKSKVGNAEGK